MKWAGREKGQHMFLDTFRGGFWSLVSFPRKRAVRTSLASVHIPLQNFAFQTFNWLRQRLRGKNCYCSLRHGNTHTQSPGMNMYLVVNMFDPHTIMCKHTHMIFNMHVSLLHGRSCLRTIKQLWVLKL